MGRLRLVSLFSFLTLSVFIPLAVGADNGQFANRGSGTQTYSGPEVGGGITNGFKSSTPEVSTASLLTASKPTAYTDGQATAFDSAQGVQALSYIKVQTNTAEGFFDQHLCSTLTDSTCAATIDKWKTLNVESLLGICAAATEACIKSFSIITSDGKEVTGTPLVAFPASAPTFAGSTINGSYVPAGSRSWIWRVAGDSNGSEHDYLITARVTMVATKSGSQWSFARPSVRMEVIPVQRELSDKVIAPAYAERKMPTGNSEIGLTTGYTDCLTTDTGVCLHRRAFPDGAQAKVSVILSKNLAGWLNGRLKAPNAVSTSINSDFDQLTIQAMPSKNIVAGGWVRNSLLPQTFFADMQTTMSTYSNLSFISTGYRIADSGNPGSISAYNKWAQYLGDKALYVDEAWMVQSTAEESTGSCAKPSDGLVGIVTTNASAYDPGPPSWDAENMSMVYAVASPHYEQDGSTQTQGTYGITLRADIMQCLFNVATLPDAATVSIVYDSSGNQTNISALIKKNSNWVYVNVAGFHFSSPKLRIKLETKSVPSAEPKPTPTPSETPIPTASATSKPTQAIVQKKVTISCVKGKVVKKVSALNPQCPTGFKKK